jgi:uncharacterized membrane protein YkvA (DUF1232 family)
MHVLRLVLVVPALVLAAWTTLAFLAARLPPGLLKELVGFVPACVTLLRRLYRDPRVPTRAKLALVVAALWVVSPIDLVPEFLPVIGPLDDIVVVVLALRYVRRQVPQAVIAEAWPGDPTLLARMLGCR